MNKKTKKYVINQQVLEDFEHHSDPDPDPVLLKQVRDPVHNKLRDQLKQNKKNRDRD